MDSIYDDKEISCEDSIDITPEDEDHVESEDENDLIDNNHITPNGDFEHVENENDDKLDDYHEPIAMNKVETWSLESVHDDEEIVGEDETQT